MKFNFDDYKGKYVMHCKTEKEANMFCGVMNENGMRWCTGASYLNHNSYYRYISTCYSFNTGECSNIQFYKNNGYTILEWSDFMDEWSDFMDKEFTKKDLKNGDIVKLKNDTIMILIRDIQTLVGQDCYEPFAMYNENLEHFANPALDIIAVRRPEEPWQCNFDAFLFGLGRSIYIRKEPEEMTLSEVCKALGKDIKIIKE